MRAAAVALLLLAAMPLHAAILFDPPVAGPHTSVDIVIQGNSGGGGGPVVESVEISGRTITVHLRYGGGISAPIEWIVVAHAGVLAAGIYDVFADYQPAGLQANERAKLIVRDDAVYVSRHVLPISGGEVDFGNSSVTQIGIDGLYLNGIRVFQIPPHAPGTVDVNVLGLEGVGIHRALLTFFDPAAPPDPALFEPILFPIAFSGAGAFGAQWSTTNKIWPSRTTWFHVPLPCAGCSDSIDKTVTLAGNAPAGQLLYVERGAAANLSFASRVRELGHGAVAPLPVFRERDLTTRRATFWELPRFPNARTTLRVWSPNERPETLSIYVSVSSHSKSEVVEAVMTRAAAGAPLFAAVELTSAIDKVDDGTPITIEADARSYKIRLWSLLAMTDNATQRTVVFTPQ